MCLCGCVCEVAGNCGGESPGKLAGPQGHHAGDEGAALCRGRWDLVSRGPQGKAESKSCAGVVGVGASPSPHSPCCTLVVVEGEEGRVPGCRCPHAGDSSCRVGG